jgi:hypothetical protein
MIANMTYRVPVFGWMLKEAVFGGPEAVVLFVINMVAIWLYAIYFFGFPALIIPALCAVPVMFVLLIAITFDGASFT